MTFDFRQFKQTPQRAWMWRIFFFAAVASALYFLYKNLFFWGIQNIFIAVLIYWIDLCEKEITKRNLFP